MGSQYIHVSGGVFIPARVCFVLATTTGGLDRYRNHDPESDDVIRAIGQVARMFSSAIGTKSVGSTELSRSLKVGTDEAAGRLGMTVRGVTKAISRGDLPATRSGRSWLIETAEVEIFKRRRKRSA